MTSTQISRQQLIDVLSLGLIQPVVGLQDSLRAMTEIGPEATAQLLFRHKVADVALDRLRAVGDPLTREAKRLLDELRRPFRDRYATAPEILEVLRQGAAEAGVTVLTMKGMAVASWYPPDVVRDIGDLDVWVATEDDGWALSAAMRAHGYIYAPEELPWIKQDPQGVLYGQIRLVEENRRTVSVDIHVGPYSVRYCGLLALDSAPGRPSWAALSDEDLICTAIANSAGDCFLDGKTLNDLVLGLARPVDPERVVVSLRAAGLLGFLVAALDEVDAVCGVSPAARAGLDALRAAAGDVRPEPITLTMSVDAALRARLVAQHAERSARHQLGLEPTAAAEIGVQAEEAYLRSSWPRVGLGTERADMPTPAPWTCVRLVPLSTAAGLIGVEHPVSWAAPARGAAAPVVVPMTEGDLLRAGGDIFVPTVDYQLSGALLTAAVST